MPCECGCTADETDLGRVHLRANLAGISRRETFRGREHVVVPVVMIRQGVLNGAFVPANELYSPAWNGTPVTIDHPQARGQDISANSPKVLEEWQVGTIFNSEVKGDRLVAEAWVDVDLAEAKLPGIVEMLESGLPMDVSTGYFPTAVQGKGNHNGKPYTQIHRELKPDHLALLPNDVGACSWEDGCGIRAAKQKGKEMPDENEERGLVAAFTKFFSTQRRGEDDDRRQIVADLISSDDTPFVPDDMFSLMDMSQDSLEDLRNMYLGTSEDEPETNNGKEGAMPDDKKTAGGATPAGSKVSDMTVEDLTSLVSNAAKDAAAEALTNHVTANRSQELIDELVANEDSGFAAEDLEGMPLAGLEKLVANLKKDDGEENPKPKPAPKTNAKPGNFGGRPVHTAPDDGAQTKKYAGMATNVSTLGKPGEKKEA